MSRLPLRHPLPLLEPQNEEGGAESAKHETFQHRLNHETTANTTQPDGKWDGYYIPSERLTKDSLDKMLGLHEVGRTCGMVEVAACEGHSHYLQNFDPQKDLDYDVASPVDGEVKAYGMFAAKRRAMGRYAENAQAGILRHGAGLGAYYRQRRNHQTWIEGPIFIHDLKESDDEVSIKFARGLVFLALNLCNQYDDDFVRSLQEQDATGIVNGLCEVMLSSDMVGSNPVASSGWK